MRTSTTYQLYTMQRQLFQRQDGQSLLLSNVRVCRAGISRLTPALSNFPLRVSAT